MADFTPGDRLDHMAGADEEDLNRAKQRLFAVIAVALTNDAIPVTRAHLGDVPVFVVMVPEPDEPQAGMPGAILIDRAVWEALTPDSLDAVKEDYQEPGDTDPVVEF